MPISGEILFLMRLFQIVGPLNRILALPRVSNRYDHLDDRNRALRPAGIHNIEFSTTKALCAAFAICIDRLYVIRVVQCIKTP